MAPNTLMTELLRSPVAQRLAPPAISTSSGRTGFQDYLDSLRTPQEIPTPPTGDPGPPRPRLPENPTADAIDDDSSKATRPSVEPKDRKPEVTRSGKKTESKTDTEASTSSESQASAPSTNTDSQNNLNTAQTATIENAPIFVPVAQINAPEKPVGVESSTEAAESVSLDQREGVVESNATRGGLTNLIKALNLTPTKNSQNPAAPAIPTAATVDAEAAGADRSRKTERNARAEQNNEATGEVAEKSASSTDAKSERTTAASISQKAAHTAPTAPRPTGELKATRKQSENSDTIQADPRASTASQKVKINEANRAEQESNSAANIQSDAESRTASKSTHSRNEAGSSVSSLDSVGKVADIKVLNAAGDGAAANIGKFLTQAGDASTKAESTSSTNSSISAVTITASRQTERVAPQTTLASTTVANLLNAGTTDADPIASTAQLLRAAGRDGHHQATLKLDPPELGQLRINIRMQEAGMTLRVDAENAAAAKLIETRLPELKDALSVHGIRVERSEIIVRTMDTGNDSTSHRDSRESHGDLNQQTHQQNSWFDERPSDSWRDQREWSPSHLTDNIATAAAEASRRVEESGVSLLGSVNLVA